MSTFKSKDLHYEKQEPSFLRRLKGIHDSADGRNTVQIARPQKSRLKTGDGDEDEPVIVDEKGDVVGRREFEGMINGDGDGDRSGGKGGKDEGNGEGVVEGEDDKAGVNGSVSESRRKEDGVGVGIGGVRKRKLVKAVGVGVGGGSDGEEGSSLPLTTGHGDKGEKSMTEFQEGIKSQVQDSKPNNGVNKPKKKSKKIKLSFDEPE